MEVRSEKMIKMMAVYDEDPQYAARLADYVNQRGKLPFTAMAFSSVEQLEEYAGEHPVELLLVGEGARDKVTSVKAKAVVMLCEGELIDQKEELPAVYKYQSGDCIMREVMASYCSCPVEPGLMLLGAKALVMGVYSPVNRCLKTSLALTMGQVLSKSMSVLYLNLEEYSGLWKLFCQGCRTDLSDALYLYRQGSFNWIKLKSMIYSQGSFDYIPPVRYGEDLSQIDPEDMAAFIGRIAREGGYDRLVVDLGNAGRGAAALLETCDVIYMPVREDNVSTAKVEEFEEYLEQVSGEQLLERIQKLRLPHMKVIGTREGYLEQLLWSELGDFVRRLLGAGS